MSRYYFDIRDGEGFVKDDEGIELPGIADAQLEAAASLAEMSKEFHMKDPDPSGYPLSVEVRDLNGPLLELAFRFVARH
jgi:hypothetical protein